MLDGTIEYMRGELQKSQTGPGRAEETCHHVEQDDERCHTFTILLHLSEKKYSYTVLDCVGL